MWTAIQLGSREHYAVPVALHEAGRLDCCITDAWLSDAAARLVTPLSPSLAGRRHKSIPKTKVRSNTGARLLTDLRLRLQKKTPWSAVLERNAWFGTWAAEQTQRVESPIVFSYAYTALLPFGEAKRRGARCILGQIDPGPVHYETVRSAMLRYRELVGSESEPPPEYWRLWREEIAMADRIVVNSEWSAKMLLQAGVPTTKVVEIPLVYEQAGVAVEDRRGGSSLSNADERLPHENLKALFLGSISVAKGIGQLFDAIRRLRREPVDFLFAGPLSVRVPDDIQALPNVRFLGPVDRGVARRLYRESDFFIFPTLSDGFGLTQLEALGQGLPVIASPNCGQVVEEQVNGLVLPAVSPDAIAEAVMRLVNDRDLLARLRSNARVPERCHLRHLAPALLALET